MEVRTFAASLAEGEARRRYDQLLFHSNDRNGEYLSKMVRKRVYRPNKSFDDTFKADKWHESNSYARQHHRMAAKRNV